MLPISKIDGFYACFQLPLYRVKPFQLKINVGVFLAEIIAGVCLKPQLRSKTSEYDSLYKSK